MKALSPLLIIVSILLFSCNRKENIVEKSDYLAYLDLNIQKVVNKEKADLKFWEQKYTLDKNQFPYLSKMASVNSGLFELTGNIEYLAESERLLLKVNEITNYSHSSFLRSLAANYIQQHKFKQALSALEKAETIGESQLSTHKMLFDVHLELGNYIKAKYYLDTFRKDNDFDYLIRYAKWQDHSGNLDRAITAMEKAKLIAESSNLKSLKLWIYTNLGDFYGHAGKIKKSYEQYLKTLELDPHNFYALKGIAWILYSYENKSEEAKEIIESILKYHNTPDYHLLISKIAAYQGDSQLSEKHLEVYFKEVNNPNYGDMYNKYNALIFADELNKPDEAIKIAMREIDHRPTAQSYDLLAWAYFRKGEEKKAYDIMIEHVVSKTFEPETLYHIAEIYKSNSKFEEARKLKKELYDSLFELGPNMESRIKQI